MIRTINLADFSTKGSRVFAGRQRGVEVRRLAEIEKSERAGDVIIFLVPDDVLSINSSFWLGLVGDSIRALKEEEFRRRFKLESHRMQPVYESGIKEALRYYSPLPSAEPDKAPKK